MTATTKLPSYSRNTKRYRRLRSFLDGLRADCGSEPLAWIALPTLAVLGRPRVLERHPAHRVPPQQIPELREPRRGQASPAWSVHGDCLFLASTVNQRRALEPLWAQFGPERTRDSVRIEPDADRADELAAGAEEFAERFVVAAKSERFRPPLTPKRVYRQLFSCAHALVYFEAALRAVAPRAAVIATTHSAHARALLLAAREAGIATVYIPHAPVISDAHLVDLPVDYAGLRGPAEVDHYEVLGAPGKRLAVVGNPAMGEKDPELRMPRVREPVLATGTDDLEALRATIELAHSVLGKRCVLSPHPRTDHDSLRELMPDGWRLWTGRTFDLLQQDPPALIQSSSGVALEGLKLGIPTIELAFPSAEPNYPFLHDPPVLFASDTRQLRAALRRARRLRRWPWRRKRLVKWSEKWVSATGETASSAARDLLERAAGTGPHPDGPIWDAWSSSAESQMHREPTARATAAGNRLTHQP
jgi:hypothetical protein